MVEKVAVTGFYGQGNFGDDVFVEILKNQSLEREGLEVVFYGAGPLKDHQREWCGFPLKSLYGRYAVIDKALRVISVLKMIFLNSWVVFGGGSVFGQFASYRLRFLSVIVAKALGRKITAYGVSIGPFKSARQEHKFIKLIKKMDAVVVRDEESSEILTRHNVTHVLAPDMAIRLREAKIFGSDDAYNDRNILVIAIHLNAYVQDVLKYLQEKKDDFDQFLLLSLDPASKKLSTEMANEMSRLGLDCSVIDYDGPDDIDLVVGVISQASYVITSKLHGAVVAASYSVPFYLFQYQDKCLQVVKSMGYSELNRPLSFDELACAVKVLNEYKNNLPSELHAYR